MVFLYRGLGIVIPIGLVAAGALLSWLVYDDATLGNLRMVGFSFLITAGLAGLVALAAAGSEPDETGAKPKHDLFFIPVAVWVPILAIVGGVSLWKHEPRQKAAAPAAKPMATAPAKVARPEAAIDNTRTLIVYNDGDTKRSFIIADDRIGKLLFSATLEPAQFKSLEIPTDSYLFSAYGGSGPNVTLPRSKEYAGDASRYALVKGKEGELYQRIVLPRTPSNNDYDHAWFMLSGTSDFAIVDVSGLYRGGNLQREQLKETDWAARVVATLDGFDLLEPQLTTADMTPQLLAPDKPLPVSTDKKVRLHLLVPVVHGKHLDARQVADAVGKRMPAR